VSKSGESLNPRDAAHDSPVSCGVRSKDTSSTASTSSKKLVPPDRNDVIFVLQSHIPMVPLIGESVPNPESWKRQVYEASPPHAIHLYRLALAHLRDDVENGNAWAALLGIAACVLDRRGICWHDCCPRS